MIKLQTNFSGEFIVLDGIRGQSDNTDVGHVYGTTEKLVKAGAHQFA